MLVGSEGHREQTRQKEQPLLAGLIEVRVVLHIAQPARGAMGDLAGRPHNQREALHVTNDLLRNARLQVVTWLHRGLCPRSKTFHNDFCGLKSTMPRSNADVQIMPEALLEQRSEQHVPCANAHTCCCRSAICAAWLWAAGCPCTCKTEKLNKFAADLVPIRIQTITRVGCLIPHPDSHCCARQAHAIQPPR